MSVSDFIAAMVQFPVNVFFVPFVIFLFIMLADLVFNFAENMLPEFDLFDMDDIPGAGLLLPPALSKVPLVVALTVVLFVGTIMAFYGAEAWSALLPESWHLPVGIVSIPVIGYLSLVVAAWILSPLSPLFDKKKAFATTEFVGMHARVHSSSVTKEYGEAVVLHQGKEILLDVVSDTRTPISFGDTVTIVAREPESQRYIVIKQN